MSYAKTAVYPDSYKHAGKLHNSLRSATRIQILRDLYSGPKSLSELMVSHDISQPSLHDHLVFLMSVDIVSFCDDQGTAKYKFEIDHAPGWYLLSLADAWKSEKI